MRRLIAVVLFLLCATAAQAQLTPGLQNPYYLPLGPNAALGLSRDLSLYGNGALTFSTDADSTVAVSAGASVLGPYGVPIPAVDLDFTTANYAAPNAPAVSRASVKNCQNIAGVWSSVLANVACRTDRGILVESARTNSAANNTNTGAVAGSPGTLPTGWTDVKPTGMTRTITLGTDANGLDYTQINWTGTAASQQFVQLYMTPLNTIAASSGQSWALSSYVANVAGFSGANDQLLLQLIAFNAGSGQSEAFASGQIPSNTFTRYVALGDLTNATTANVAARISTDIYQIGEAVNVTVKVGGVQLEQGVGATSIILTTGAAATRAADVVSVSGLTFGTSYSLLANGEAELGVASPNDQYLVAASDGTTTNRYGLLRRAATGYPTWAIDTTLTTIQSTGFSAGVVGAIAGSNAVGAQYGAANGSVAASGTSTTSPAGLTTFQIGADGAGANQFNGYIRRVVVWPSTALAGAFASSLSTALPPGYLLGSATAGQLWRSNGLGTGGWSWFVPPTSCSGLPAGALWNDAGTPKVCP